MAFFDDEKYTISFEVDGLRKANFDLALKKLGKTKEELFDAFLAMLITKALRGEAEEPVAPKIPEDSNRLPKETICSRIRRWADRKYSYPHMMLAAYFEAGVIDEISIGAFIVILLLFGCYVMHNHYMIDRHAETHGIVLMYSHYAIVMSLNVVTACQARLPHSGETEAAVALTMVGATLLYFGAVFLNAVYYGRKLWRPAEKGLAAAVLLAGAAIVLILRSGRACLAGMLVMSGGLMILLLWKAHAARITCHECEEEEEAA